MIHANETFLNPSDVAGLASAENGYVILDGPQGIAITMTIEAAMATAENLIAATLIAAGQL